MGSDAGHLLDDEQPAQYNFKHWDDFWRNALRYHNKMHPNNDLVIDRINTLREFMSERAIDHLGVYMKPHPRFRTTQGWDDWIKGASAILSTVDQTISPRHTVNDWLTAFKDGKITEQQLWHGLDAHVVYGDIATVEQRELFWNALSWKAQERLLKRSPYFYPQHEVWADPAPGVSEGAEQKLALIMELAKWDDSLARERRPLVCVTIFGLVVTLLAVLLTVWAVNTASNIAINSCLFLWWLVIATMCYWFFEALPPFLEVERDRDIVASQINI